MCAVWWEESFKVVGVCHGEKWHERLLTNEKCAKAIDFGKFYRAPEDKRMLNCNKFSGRIAGSAMC